MDTSTHLSLILDEYEAIKQSNLTSRLLNNGDGGLGGRADHKGKQYFRAFGVTDFTGFFYQVLLNNMPSEKKKEEKLVAPVFF